MTTPTDAMASLSVTAPKGTFKRDALRANEIQVQAMWEENKAFESNASDDQDKFLVTFPYPYSNGHLHIGHAFSLTKAVFRAQFERHQGKNVLFPFAFHCTGMPIQAVRALPYLVTVRGCHNARLTRHEIDECKHSNSPEFSDFITL